MRAWWPSLVALWACDPYSGWPDPHGVYPWVVQDELELEPWEAIRWEEGPWDPLEEPEKNGLYLQKALFHRPGAPTEALYHWGLARADLPPVVDEALNLVFVGDVMDTGDPPTAMDAVVPLLASADLRIGNLETPVAPSVPVAPGPPAVPRFNAPAALLDQLPLDVLQVVNNHSLDAGDAGLEQTLAELEARGLFAAGVDGQLLLDFGDGLIVALLAYTWGLNEPDAASAHDLAVVDFGGPGRTRLGRIRRDIAAAREAGAVLVVVMPHWGFEYEYYPDPRFLRIGRRIVAAGADLVVGHGAHTPQPAEWCTVNIPAHPPGLGSCSLRTDDGQPRYAAILYGLGNFGTTQPTLPLQVGLVAQVSLLPELGVVGLGWEAVVSVTEDGRQVLHPLDELLDDPAHAEEADRLARHLGTGWAR